MKICTVWGDLHSDKSSENYPTDLYCEDCFQAMRPDQEDSKIVSYENYEKSYGDTCVECGKTKQEEEAESQ